VTDEKTEGWPSRDRCRLGDDPLTAGRRCVGDVFDFCQDVKGYDVLVRVQPARQAGARPGRPACRARLSPLLHGGQRHEDRDDLLDGYGVLDWQLPVEQVVLRQVLHPALWGSHRQGLRALELCLLPDEGPALLVNADRPQSHIIVIIQGSEGSIASLPAPIGSLFNFLLMILLWFDQPACT